VDVSGMRLRYVLQELLDEAIGELIKRRVMEIYLNLFDKGVNL
jgi:hypothetical protein